MSDLSFKTWTWELSMTYVTLNMLGLHVCHISHLLTTISRTHINRTHRIPNTLYQDNSRGVVPYHLPDCSVDKFHTHIQWITKHCKMLNMLYLLHCE